MFTHQTTHTTLQKKLLKVKIKNCKYKQFIGAGALWKESKGSDVQHTALNPTKMS